MLVTAMLTTRVAYAIEITAPVTETVSTSGSGGIIISATGSVSTVTSSAVEFDGSTSVDNTLTIYNLLSSGTSATIAVSSSVPAAGAVTIDNRGTVIQNTPGVAAIDLSNMGTNAATLTNRGTISGSVVLTGQSDNVTITQGGSLTGNLDLGDGNNTLAVTNGTIKGNTSGGTGTDTIKIGTGSTITGNLDAGNGTNAVEISNSTVTGNVLTGAGTDIISINTSTVTGDVSDTDGGGTLGISNSTINGNLKTGNGSTAVTLTNATITGEISDSTVGGDADTLNVKGNTFTTHGGISGFETLNVSATTFNLNHGLTGVSDLRTDAASTLNVDNNFTTAIGGTITNAGTLNLLNGRHISTDAFTSTGTVGISVVSSQTAAGISATAGNVTLTGGQLAINMGENAGYIASGTQYTIGTGTGGATTAGTLANANTGVYRYSTSVTGGNNLILTIGRVSTSSVVQGQTAHGIADTLDTLGANTTDNLTKLQSLVGNQPDAAGVQSVVESFGPGIDGAAVASVNVTQATGNQVSQRLASLRGGWAGTGIATGDPMAARRMWVQGFANHVNQDNSGGASGYTADASGGSIGLDTDNWFNGITTGLAVSYGKTNVDSKSASNASTGISSYVATLYASKVFAQGSFINAQFGGGYNDYTLERNVAGVGTANGTTNGWQGTAKLEIGQDIAMGQATFTPLVSAQYTHLTMEDYTETGLGNAGLHVQPGSLNTVDVGAGARLAYGFPLANGGTFSPSMHAMYLYRLGDDALSTTSNFIGGGGAFNTQGVAADRTSINAGVGLLLSTVGGTDLTLDYDADIRSNLIGHAGQVKARWTF